MSGFFAAHIYIIIIITISERKRPRYKRTTTIKRRRNQREREERESVSRTRVIITPIIATRISHVKSFSQQKFNQPSTPFPHNFQNSGHQHTGAREKKTPPKQSLSLSDGVPSDRPNNVSSSFSSSWFSSSSSDTNHRPKRFVFGKISLPRAVPVANRHDGKDPFRLA